MISYDSARGGVSVVTEKGVESSSSLLIQNARPPDSGKYVCRPENAEPASINVHVLNGQCLSLILSLIMTYLPKMNPDWLFDFAVSNVNGMAV